MSHEIDQTTGKPAMAFFGAKPWHGLGTEVQQAMTSLEAITLGGLDFEVLSMPVYDHTKTKIEGYQALTRSDTGSVLSIMGKRYVPLQNRVAFECLDELIKEGLRYETVGALKGGRTVWGLAKLPGEIRVTGRDIVNKYLLFTNSHDGTKTVSVYFTPVRVVCWNTLHMSLTQSDYLLKAKHTASAGKKIAALKTLFEDIRDQEKQFETMSARMIKHKVSQTDVDDFLLDLFLRDQGLRDTPEDIPTRTKNTIDQVKELCETGMGTDLEGVKGSAWGLYNAVTEYTDHVSTVKGIEEDPTRRLDSNWFGSGAALKEKALEKILEMVGA